MKTKEEIKEIILKDLSQVSYSCVDHLYNFDGSWLSKEKALNELDNFSNDIKLQLSDYYEVMKEITINDIVKKCHEVGSDWLNKYGKYGRGRTSSTQLDMCKLENSDVKSDFIINNFDVLTRTRIFIGLCLGIGSKFELQGLISHVIKNEMESNVFLINSKISNAVFRIRLLESYLKDTKFENLLHETNLDLILGSDNISLFNEEYKKVLKIEQRKRLNYFISEQKRLSDKENEIKEERYQLLIDLIKHYGSFNDINRETNILFDFTLGIGKIEQVYLDNDELFISGKNNFGVENIDKIYKDSVDEALLFCTQLLKI